MIRFISSDTLIGTVQEELSSFDSAGLIDTGLFHSKIKKALNDLGLSVKLPAEQIIYPEQYKVKLPEDMTDWYALYRLQASESRTERRIHSDRQVYRETEICQLQKDKCCELEIDGVFIREQIVSEGILQDRRQFENMGLLRYVPRGPFRPGGLARCWAKGSPCIEHRSTSEFSEDENYLHFNFTGDPVLLQYYAFPLDNGLPMVPDEPRVQDFLAKKLIYETFRKLYYNGDAPDLERRIQLAKSEYDSACADALNWAKTPSFKSLMAYARSRAERSVFAPFESRYR